MSRRSARARASRRERPEIIINQLFTSALASRLRQLPNPRFWTATVIFALESNGLATRRGIHLCSLRFSSGLYLSYAGQILLTIPCFGGGFSQECQHPTSNTQHRTSNELRFAHPLDVGCSMLDVGCSLDFHFVFKKCPRTRLSGLLSRCPPENNPTKAEAPRIIDFQTRSW